MNAFDHFPTRLHWNAQQLADAVPPRLHQLFVFDAARDNDGCRAAANSGWHRPRGAVYASRSAMPVRFDVR